jgi:hypothetical protein
VRSPRLFAPLTAHTVSAACFCLCERLVVLSYLDKASLDVAVRRDPCTVQVFSCSIAKVASFGPRKQFSTSA